MRKDRTSEADQRSQTMIQHRPSTSYLNFNSQHDGHRDRRNRVQNE